MQKLLQELKSPQKDGFSFDGEDITDWSITERAKHGISYAFQQPVRFKRCNSF